LVLGCGYIILGHDLGDTHQDFSQGTYLRLVEAIRDGFSSNPIGRIEGGGISADEGMISKYGDRRELT
jgi:hypothetical protein